MQNAKCKMKNAQARDPPERGKGQERPAAAWDGGFGRPPLRRTRACLAFKGEGLAAGRAKEEWARTRKGETPGRQDPVNGNCGSRAARENGRES